MSATFTWLIDWMNVKPSEGSYTDVVVTAGWRCNGATAETLDGYAATSFGTASFPMPEGTFTPYDQLTQDQVLGWCWASGVDKEAIEADVQTQIDNQVNPPIVQPPLPWAPQPAPPAA
jgi:hypothetical protein